MGPRWMWLTLVGIVVLGLVAVAGVVLRGENQALKPKRSVAPSLNALSGAGGTAAAVSRGSKAAAPALTIGEAVTPVSMDRDLRDLPLVPADPLSQRPELAHPVLGPKQGPAPIPAPAPPAQAPNMPATIANFNGINFAAGGAGYPPDTVGDVGLFYFIQAVNTSIAIYNKNGTTALAPFTFNSLWAGAGTGTACDTSHRGDPTVVYDPLAQRWFVADFAWGVDPALRDGPYYECIAVSKSNNVVSGGWWLYAVRADDAAHPWLNDYPKMGIWPDGLYTTFNMFDCLTLSCSSSSYEGVRAMALPRTTMETGAVVTPIIFDVSTSFFSLMPGNMRNDSPPAGRENLLVSEAGFTFDFEVWKFRADFATPAMSTFTGPTLVSQTSYTLATATVTTPSNSLDSLEDRIMMQNQYTNIGGAESLWVNHTVRTPASGPNGIQWAQLNVTGGAISAAPVQQQIYGNLGTDGVHRWMGSLAVDKAGNMALGYSASRDTLNPVIRYNGRLAGDGLNTLPQGETDMFAGTGSQTGLCGGGTCTRWGDYSAMTLDPDGCTFWYTQEYYTANDLDWDTRIGSFKYPPAKCTPTPPTAVSIAALTAGRTKQGVAVSWRTASEAAMVGFHVWRQGSTGKWTKLNRKLIAAKRAGQSGGAAYRFVDRTASRVNPYQYRLQVVTPAGKRAWYGLATVAAR